MAKSRRRRELRALKERQPDPELPELPRVCCVCGREIQPGDAWQSYLFEEWGSVSATLTRHADCAPPEAPDR